MPIRRDWFKEQVEVLVQALGAALGLKKKGEVQAAVERADDGFHKAFGMNGRLAIGLPFDQFLFLALRGETPSEERLAALAAAFKEWGEVLEAAGRQAEADAAFKRAEECKSYKA